VEGECAVDLKVTREQILAAVRRRQVRRLAAIKAGRQPVEARPTEDEIQAARDRWQNIKHSL